jgi:hypothetical protein
VNKLIRSKKFHWLLLALAPFQNYGCFGAFYPSQADVAQRANVRFPPSTVSLEWQCQPSIEGDRILVRFSIAPRDLQYIIHAPSYLPHNLIRPIEYFSTLFDDAQLTEKNLQRYSTYQGDSACGWTIIAMDDPELYTVYAYYQDWDDCSFFDLTVVPLLP